MKRNSVSLFLSLFNPKAFFLFTKLHFILESSMHYDCSLILHDKGCVTKQAEFILCLDVNLICVPKFSSLEWRTVEVKVLCELLRTETSQRNKNQNMQITCWSVLGQNKRANWNKSLSLFHDCTQKKRTERRPVALAISRKTLNFKSSTFIVCEIKYRRRDFIEAKDNRALFSVLMQSTHQRYATLRRAISGGWMSNYTKYKQVH